jgi:hypothetical protein
MAVHTIAVLEIALPKSGKVTASLFWLKKCNRLAGGDIRQGYLTMSLCTLKSSPPTPKKMLWLHNVLSPFLSVTLNFILRVWKYRLSQL